MTRFSDFTSRGHPRSGDFFAGYLAGGGAGSDRRFQWSDVRPFIDVRDYGAVSDGSTDDAAAIQAAIDACPSGGAVYMPAFGSYYNLIGSGNQILSISRPIRLFGDMFSGGSGTLLGVHSSVPTTRDVIKVVPGSSVNGFNFHDFGISAFGGNTGRHAISIDTTNFAYNFYLSRLLLGILGGGASIKQANGTSGWAYSVIKECNFDKIDLAQCGDGVTIRDCVGAQIKASQVSGAGGLLIQGNVLAGAAEQIILNKGYAVIDSNEFEQTAFSTGANGAMVDLNGADGACEKTIVSNNTFSVIATKEAVSALRVHNAKETRVFGNRFGIRSSSPQRNHIVITSSAVDTHIDHSNSYYTNDVVQSGTGIVINDSGTRTSIREIDGNCYYASVSSQRALMDLKHFLTLSADQTGSNVNTSQTWFPGGGATQITVKANTAYFFEGELILHRTAGTTSHFTSLEMEGTATVSGFRASFDGVNDVVDGVVLGVPTQGGNTSNPAGMLVGSTTSSATEDNCFRIKGIVRFSGAGTWIPKFKYNNAPGGAPTVRAGTRFVMTPIGLDTVLNVGPWS